MKPHIYIFQNMWFCRYLFPPVTPLGIGATSRLAYLDWLKCSGQSANGRAIKLTHKPIIRKQNGCWGCAGLKNIFWLGDVVTTEWRVFPIEAYEAWEEA